MRGPLGDKVRLQHILNAIDEVHTYLHAISYDQFQKNSEKRFATVKQIEIIGEACNALTETLRLANPGVPWKPIRGFRNISVHEYFGVNFHLVWEVATVDLPVLREKISSILREM
jgi:uncharacterized protein with HEPN domain